MGTTYALIKVHNKEKTNVKELNLLVDTGSTYTWIHRKHLEGLSILPERRHKFETIEGRLVERDVGIAYVEYENVTVPTMVVLAEENDKEVLGLHALEGLALEVDPTQNKLKKAEAILAI